MSQLVLEVPYKEKWWFLTYHNLLAYEYSITMFLFPLGEPPIRSRYAHLTVLVAPDPPRIVQGAFIDATEEQPIVIECVSVGGKPAAEVSFLK